MAQKKSNNLIYKLIGVVVVLLILAFVGKKQGWIGKEKETEVELTSVKRTTIVEKVSASGLVQPELEVKISPDVSGEIIELHVKEGDSVERGKLLIKIRPDNYQSALTRSQANLNQQKANLADSKARESRAAAQLARMGLEYKRNQKLLAEKVISESDFEQIETNYEVAKQDLESAKQSVIAAKYNVQSSVATVKQAQEDLSLTSVHAPMTGIISKLAVEKGERVVGTSQMAGTEMLRIADLSRMEVRVDVNENDIIRVSMGDTAIIDVDSYSYMDKEFKGIVTAIANTANEKKSTDEVTEFEVRISILSSSYEDLIKGKNIKSPFRPGMTASVDILTSRKAKALSVPLSAVTTRNAAGEVRNQGEEKMEDDGRDNNNSEMKPESPEKDVKEVVFVNNNGIAKMVEVKTGISDYENIEVLKGLQEGQSIISGPFMTVSKNLKDGDKIKTEDKNKKKPEKKGS